MTTDPNATTDDILSRAELIAAATRIHDDQGCGCDPRYLMSCRRLANAILSLTRRAEGAR
jgi:hypothetical protein